MPGRTEGERVEVGGRVIHAAPGEVTLADALGAVVARGSFDAKDAEAGDLVVVSGVVAGGRLEGCALVEQRRPAAFGRAGGDPSRVLFGGAGRRLVQRARAIDALRARFVAEGFLEVETPALVPSPGLDVHLAGVEADGGYLITSPEYQMKRLVAGGLPRCFQLARCFRQGERGARHNPEFTMLEWYRAFAGYESVMEDTTAAVRAVADAIGGGALSFEGRAIDVTGDFERITVAEAFARWAGLGADAVVRLAAEDEDAYFRVMVETVEPAIAQLPRPVYLVDYPASQASLARKKPDDPRFAERFELFAGGIELCNGFGELTDPVEQRARLVADQAERARRGLPVYPIDERFLAALEEGLPPCAGNALGVDRLVMLAAGASTIGDVQAFPADVL